MVSQAALLGIHAYQRWMSPRKGYRCAYSVRHGGTGCSGFAKHAIRDHGLFGALPLIRRRFQDCRAAWESMHTQPAEGEDKKPKKRRGWLYADPADCCGFLPTVQSCRPGSSSRGVPDAARGCELNPCDGGCDCNPCG